MPTVEFADIRIRAALPLHPYLSKHPHLFLRLVADGRSVCGDTAGVDGDLAGGVWEFNGRLYAPRVKQLLNVGVLTGAKGPGIPVVSVTIKVAELLERAKACRNGRHDFDIFDSGAPIQLKLVMTCSIKSSSILDVVSNAADDKGRSKINQSDVHPAKMDLSSRENLETLYQITARTPDGDESKARTLSRLGHAYYGLYEKEYGEADLEKAIYIHEEAMQRTGPFDSRLAVHMGRFSMALLERFQQSENYIDIERGISYAQTALRFTEDLDETKSFQLKTLGIALQLRFKRFGSIADQENSILYQREAIGVVPDGHPDKPGRLGNLGATLISRFERLGCLADLENAISNIRWAIQLTPDGHTGAPTLFTNLGHALQSRFERLGVLRDLEDAISNGRKAVQITPDGHPDKPGRFCNLGLLLRSLFERLGVLADMEDAISNIRKAVQLTPDGHPDKPGLFVKLGAALQSRFERLYGLADLQEAVSSLQQGVRLVPDGHPEKLYLLTNFGLVLRSRFERLGVLADLENAISNLQQGVELMSDGHPDKPGQFSCLGIALLLRFERLGGLADLEDAISNFRRGVQLTPDNHPGKPSQLGNLGITLRSRFECLGVLQDLEGAISNLQQAFQLMQDGHPDIPQLFDSLGVALECRFEHLGVLVDLEAAISNLRQAVKLTPDDHPKKPGRLHNLGGAFSERFRRFGILNDLESALSNLSNATNSRIGSPKILFNSACAWAKISEEQSRSPLDAYNCAINLLPRIAWLGLAVPDQHALLADVGGIVRNAVAAAIRYEEYETAVVWAEQGRSIVWQNLLGLRSPVEDLHGTHPELADRLRDIAEQLEGSGSHLEMPTASAGDTSLNYSKSAIEWDNIIEEVRRIPRFEGFLKAKSFRQLAPAAHEGPVVILNVNDAQCDALVLIADGSDDKQVSIVNIPLERFSDEKSKKLFQTLMELLSSAGVRERNDRKTGRVQSQVDGEAKFKVVLGILWKDVVKPVIEGLALQTESKRPPRIWWCVTGLLAFLPIHAAGLYDTQEEGQKISDYVVSSYTPALTAILGLSDPIMQDDFQVLTVAQASAPGAPPIPKTEDEVRIIHGLTTDVRRVSLMGKDATVERVQKEMTQSSWIHLACHGKQNSDNPMESGFLLHDRMLKLSEIVKMSLPKTEFAFLSACQTAMGDEKVAEESVHLAAGMLLSGCRGVIATTWSIRDEDGPRIAEDVYGRIFKDGKPNRKEAAYALCEAVKRLRDSGAKCTSWVPFIHIGR